MDFKKMPMSLAKTKDRKVVPVSGIRTLFLFLLFAINFPSLAQHATWIWYPGDFEIDLANKMQNRRTERGTFLPVFWKMDAPYVLVDFHREFKVAQPEQVKIYAEGEYNVRLDGKAFE